MPRCDPHRLVPLPTRNHRTDHHQSHGQPQIFHTQLHSVAHSRPHVVCVSSKPIDVKAS